jgi:hypothetical protein
MALFLPVLHAILFGMVRGIPIPKTLAQWVKNYNRNDDGAISVDWVVITSAVIGLSLAVVLIISNGTQIYATFMSEDLEEIAYEMGQGD